MTCCSIYEEKLNSHYVIYYWDGGYNNKLGDIFFTPRTIRCSVRFYGWGAEVPLEYLTEILLEIEILEKRVRGGIANGYTKYDDYRRELRERIDS